MDASRQRSAPRVLIIYYSLSGQSRGLVNLLAAGIRSEGNTVIIEQLKALRPIGFPFPGIWYTLKMMVATFFRLRVPIAEPSPVCFERHDLIVLAGPTWSYNPSGPVLSLLDRYGRAIFAGQRVQPLISCRGYHRLHNFVLRRRLRRCGASLDNSLIFSHPVPEPWSTIGVFLKSAGFHPETMQLLSGRFPSFGHTTEQLHRARAIGADLGRSLYAAHPEEDRPLPGSRAVN